MMTQASTHRDNENEDEADRLLQDLDPRPTITNASSSLYNSQRGPHGALSFMRVLDYLVFITLALVIILLEIKNNFFKDDKQLTYLYALAVPLCLLKLELALMVYFRLLAGLQDSHRGLFICLTITLVFLVISFAGTVVLLSFYFDLD